MAVPTPLVEIGFDLTENGTGPFFRLDDPVKGKLDNTEWLLGGTLFYDVTHKVKTISITRGKNRELDQYDQGLANIVFNNNDRTFDPLYASSPYYGQIIPRREVRVSSGGVLQFFGTVDDWNLNYEPNGDSTVAAACSDGISLFATQYLGAVTNSAQKSGERLNTILDLPEVNWSADRRDIETGQMTLGADSVADGTGALEYMRLVTRSEPGSLFMSKAGSVVFRDRLTAPTSGGVLLSDDGTGIPYANLVVEYGSELMYNEVTLSSVITDYSVTAISQESIDTYGTLGLSREGLLVNENADLDALAVFLAKKYKDPEYRFKALDIVLDQRTPSQQADILGLELGDVVQIKFTPNGIAPAIDRYAEIISIDHAVDSVNHVVRFGFSTLDFALLVLDDPVFGKLDNGNALAF